MSDSELLEGILPEITAEIKKILCHLSSLEHMPMIEEVEMACRSAMLVIGARLIEAVVVGAGMGHQGTRIPCDCGGLAVFHAYRHRTVQTLVGTPTFRRAYYYCPSCKKGTAPMDALLGITGRQISKALERSICRLSSVESFESAVQDIEELTGASVSAKAAQIISEAAGEDLLLQTRKQAREAVKIEVEIVPEDRPEVVCIAMDGKMIPTLGGHKELKVATVYDLVPPKEGSRKKGPALVQGRTSYVGQFAAPDLFGESVFLEGSRRGAESAKAVVILGDGAHWIWEQARVHYPEAVQILDWWHVSEHIWDLGRALYGEDTKKTARFVGYKLDQIMAGKASTVITALQRLMISNVDGAEKLRQTINYLETNRNRMQYPKYRRKGYHIGSGVVESGCKQFGARLDQAGMRWSQEGAGAIAALRALRLSGRWDQHWQPVRQPVLV